jgi:transcriptional regulator with XRE-family HTH domain
MVCKLYYLSTSFSILAHVQSPSVVLDQKAQRKQKTKERKQRREELQQLEKMAKVIALKERQAIIDCRFNNIMSQYRNGGGSPPGLAELQEIQKVIEAPYEDTIDINLDSKPQSIDVVIQGFAAHAAPTTARNAILKVLADKKGVKKAKIIHCKVIVSTKRGADESLSLSHFFEPSRKANLKASAEKHHEKVTKELAGLAATITSLDQHITDHPDEYWLVFRPGPQGKAISTGKVLDNICKLFGVTTPQGAKRSVQDLREQHKKKNASKEDFDQKVKAFQRNLTPRRLNLQRPRRPLPLSPLRWYKTPMTSTTTTVPATPHSRQHTRKA